jgi:broad specificity phosphatase PhoE
MSTLLLIRHGQAHAFDADSDRLTSMGEEQARRTGEYLLKTGFAADEVRTGSLRRQRHTAEIVADVYRGAGKPWPVATVDAAWNEYPADSILGVLLPELARVDPTFAEAAAAMERAMGGPDRNRYFQRMFETLMDRWVGGSVGAPTVETFDSFHSRVRAALGGITHRQGSGQVVVFTSGGPIGVSVQEALGAPRGAALKVNWRVRNASLTELTFSGGRVSLDGFNAVGHLLPDLLTYR